MKWAFAAGGAALVVAVVLLLVLYMQAVADKDEAQESLEEANSALAEATVALDEATAALDDSEAALADSEKELDATELAAIDFLAVSMAAGMAADEETSRCMATAMYEARGRLILSDFAAEVGTSAEAELGLLLIQAAEGCGSTLEDILIMPESTPAAEPESTIEILYAECAAGVLEACDALFVMAEPSSLEEFFGMTCGERFTLDDAPVFCGDAVE